MAPSLKRKRKPADRELISRLFTKKVLQKIERLVAASQKNASFGQARSKAPAATLPMNHSVDGLVAWRSVEGGAYPNMRQAAGHRSLFMRPSNCCANPFVAS